ncbi:MAG: cohesin domain-containing protein [bacterium]
MQKYLKQTFFIFFAVCSMVCSIFILPKISSAQEIYLSPGSASLNKGDDYAITLSIQGVRFLDRIGKVITNVKYDKDILQYDYIEPKGFFAENNWLYTITPDSDTGDINIIASLQSGIYFSGKDDLITIHFKAIDKGSAEVYSYDGHVYDFLSRMSAIDSTGSAYVNIDAPVSVSSMPLSPQEEEVLYAVTIQVNDVEDLAGFSADINYEPAVLSYVNVLPGEFFSREGCNFTSSLKEEAVINITADCYDFTSTGGNLDLATVYFRAIASDITQVTYSNNYLYNSVSEEIAASWEPVIFNVEAQPDDTAPWIFNDGSPSGALGPGITETELKIETDENALCRYGETASSSYETMTDFELSGAFIHSQKINLNESKSYNYYVKCADAIGNVSSDFLISFSKASPSNSGSDSGGAVSAPSYSSPAVIIYSDSGNSNNAEDDYIESEEPETEIADADEIVEVDADAGAKEDREVSEISDMVLADAAGGIAKNEINYSSFTNLAGVKSAIVEIISYEEAKIIYANKKQAAMNKQAAHAYNKIMEENKDKLADNVLTPIMFFIQNGTNTTKSLGIGERAGVIDSYVAAFGKFPASEKDWKDVIKLANGRWPAQRNEAKEDSAIANFKKIYRRLPDRKNLHDDAAVMLSSYGLRPAKRNLNAEKAAIKIFKNIYTHNAKTASEWDLVRAIAYSGAAR